MSEPEFAGRVSLRDVVASWRIPAVAGETEILAEVGPGLFRLSPDRAEPTLILSGGAEHYRLGAQTVLPGPTELAVVAVAAGTGTVRLAKRRDRHRAGDSELDFFPPVFVNTTVSGFAACLDEYLSLSSELEVLGRLTPAQWAAQDGEVRTIEALTRSTRRVHAVDPEALGDERHFWFSTLDGLWGELVDDGTERFERLLAEPVA